MTMVFPEWAYESSAWQSNVVKFLSSHKKYRIFGWEFGPTLLDYLYRVRENKQPDYVKNGLIITYSITPVVALISFASTRRATFTAAATLGVMLFGVLITVAIDYQKTKRENNSEEEYCLRLLEGLDEMPKYWWWPWGKKIKDVEITEKEIERAIDYSDYSLISRLFYSLFTNVTLHQLCIARYGYFYNYQKLTEGKMPNIPIPQPVKDGCKKVYNAVGDGLSKAVGSVSSLISSTIKNEEVADKLEARSSNLIRKIFNVGDESTATLKKALEALEIEWLPLYLDKSLEGVRAGTKTIENHNKYFNERVREIVKLSLTYHPDKQEQNVNTNNEQGLINDVTKALRNIHDYVTKDKGMLEQRVVYRLFEDAPIKNIIDRDTFVVANIVAKSELSSIAFWEGEILMRGRNKYLSSARSCLKVLSELPESRDIIDNVRSTFDKNYNHYGNLYQEKWIKNLEELSKRCIGMKELEIVKGDVDMLLKESKEQYKILEGGHELIEGKADKMFIQPMLEYCVLMNIYFAFFNVVDKKDISKCCSERDSISEEEKQNIEKLSRYELLESARDTCSELASKLTKNKKGKLVNQEGRESRMKELGKVLFKLECATKLLEEEFKVKETLIEREEKRIEADREERRQKLEAIENEIKEAQERTEQEIQRAGQEAQGRQEAEQRAEQALVGQAASFMRIAESSSDKNKMIIYQARVRILKDLLMLYRETNSRVSLYLRDDKVYQAREEVYTIHEEMHELVKEIGRDVILNSITRAEDLVKKSGTIMLNLKKYKLGEEDYKRLEQEVNNLIEQEAQRAEQVGQRARQLEQALEQKNLEKVAIRACARKLARLDDELQDAVNKESEDKIIEAAVSCTRGSPERVIDAIIEEIKVNRDQVIREGRVSVGVIETGVRSFSSQGTSLSDVNVSHGASAGVSRDSGVGNVNLPG